LGGDDAAGFSINSTTGVITMIARDFESPADADTDNAYEVTIIVTDSDNNTDSETQTVTVTDVFDSETLSFRGLTYTTVLSPDTGKVWLDRNLGASQVCTSQTDSACYGNYYQWGRDDDGHELRSSSITRGQADSISPGHSMVILSSERTWTSVDANGSNRQSAWADGGVNDICPSGYGVPTIEELRADTIQATTTTITNGDTAFSSFLKLSKAGYGLDLSLESLGVTGYYWSRSYNGTGFSMNLSGNSATIYSGILEDILLSVRCIKN
jgi:hypothetical protein